MSFETSQRWKAHNKCNPPEKRPDCSSVYKIYRAFSIAHSEFLTEMFMFRAVCHFYLYTELFPPSSLCVFYDYDCKRLRQSKHNTYTPPQSSVCVCKWFKFHLPPAAMYNEIYPRTKNSNQQFNIKYISALYTLFCNIHWKWIAFVLYEIYLQFKTSFPTTAIYQNSYSIFFLPRFHSLFLHMRVFCLPFLRAREFFSFFEFICLATRFSSFFFHCFLLLLLLFYFAFYLFF